MSYTKRNYEDVEQRAPGMHWLREPLGCDDLGVTVLDVDEGWQGKTHDHAEDGQEEVYVLIEGAGRITVDGEDGALDPGDAVRVAADSTRGLEFDDDSLMLIAGASGDGPRD